MRTIAKIYDWIRQRPNLTTYISTGWNSVYALFNGILGVIHHSWWFVTLFAFYAVLGMMRLSAVTVDRSTRRTEASVMRHNGIAMIALSIVLVGMTLLTIREHINPARNTIIMITIAAFTFTLAVWSVRNMVLAHRIRSMKMITLRNISCAATIGSVLSLERGMLGTFGDTDLDFVRAMEAASGGVAFLLIIGLGVGMILYAYKMGAK